MRARVSHAAGRLNYQTRLTVETVMVRRGIAGTRRAKYPEQVAHQKLVDLRELLPRIAECFHLAGAPERLIWFLEPLDRAVDPTPLPLLSEAAVLEEETDGDEGTAWEVYQANPTLANWDKYKRVSHRYIARLQLKLRAGDAKHGRIQ